jgi:hypothetical protein
MIRFQTAVTATVLAAGHVQVLAQPFSPTIIVGRGDSVLGLPEHIVAGPNGLYIAPNGRITVSAGLWGPTTLSAVAHLENGQLRLVVHDRMPADGAGPGEAFEPYAMAPGVANTVDDGNRVYFRGWLTGPGLTWDTKTSIWSHDSGGLNLLMRSGTSVPEAGPQAILGHIEPLKLGAPGSIYTTSRILDPARPLSSERDTALWRIHDGGRTMIARGGDAVPGFPGMTWLRFRPDQDIALTKMAITPTASDRLVFAVELMFPSQSEWLPSLWSHKEGEGLRHIGLVSHATFENLDTRIKLGYFSKPSVTANDHMAFRALLWGGNIPGVLASHNNSAIVTTSLGGTGTPSLRVIAREGDTVPGHPTLQMAVFTGSGADDNKFGDPQVNRHGHVAFITQTNNPSYVTGGRAVLYYDGESVRTLSVSGDPVPGHPGIRIGLADHTTMSFNDFGDIAYIASSGLGLGLFVHIAGGELLPVALPGDVVPDAYGNLRTIESMFIGGTTQYPPIQPTWDASRNLYFRVFFTDQSFGLLSVQIPTPATWVLVLGGLLAGCRRRRSKSVQFTGSARY